MANCRYCGRNNYAVDAENLICATCRDMYELDDIDMGARWLCQGHTMECVRRMLDFKLCNCGVINEKSKSQRVDDTKGIK